MLKEIIHYLTLSTRTNKRLRNCISLLNEEQTKDNHKINNNLKNKEIGLAVKYLIEKGEESEIKDSVYWSNLYSVATEHKVRDKIIELESKTNSV
jgi:hypothetical protein